MFGLHEPCGQEMLDSNFGTQTKILQASSINKQQSTWNNQ